MEHCSYRDSNKTSDGALQFKQVMEHCSYCDSNKTSDGALQLLWQ